MGETTNLEKVFVAVVVALAVVNSDTRVLLNEVEGVSRAVVEKVEGKVVEAVEVTADDEEKAALTLVAS